MPLMLNNMGYRLEWSVECFVFVFYCTEFRVFKYFWSHITEPAQLGNSPGQSGPVCHGPLIVQTF